MEAFGRKLLWGSGKVTEASAFHQDGGRCTAPTAEDHAKTSAGFSLKCCCPTAPLQSGGPAPLAGVNTVCSLAGWVPEEMIHSGPGAHSGHQGQRMWLEGPWGGCCTHSKQVPPGPGGAQGLHRYMQAANKVISSSSCCLSTDGGTPRADYFWLAISDCSCLSQLG